MPGTTADAAAGAGEELDTAVPVHAAINKNAGATAEDLIILSVHAWKAWLTLR